MSAPTRKAYRNEVQHFTLCDGWANTWTVHQGDGSGEPETFETIKAALAAIDEFLADIRMKSTPATASPTRAIAGTSSVSSGRGAP